MEMLSFVPKLCLHERAAQYLVLFVTAIDLRFLLFAILNQYNFGNIDILILQSLQRIDCRMIFNLLNPLNSIRVID